MNMTLAQATADAEKKINSKDEALAEAIAMLSAIAHGETFGNWEYLAALHRMRAFAAPVETRPVHVVIIEHLAKMGISAEVWRAGFVRADAGEGSYVLVSKSSDGELASGGGEGWLLSVVDENDDEQERETLPARANAFDVACAVYQLINPNAGRR